MNGTALIAAARDALIAAELGPVYLAGAVPAKHALPFFVLSILPSSSARVAVDAELGSDGIQVDVMASTTADAMDLSDAADAAVLGLGSVAVAQSPTTFGLRRASGSWRTVFPSEPSTSGERVTRVAALYTQAEIRPL